MLIQVMIKNAKGDISKIMSIDVPEHVIDNERLILVSGETEKKNILIQSQYIYWNTKAEQYEVIVREKESSSETEGIDL